MAKQINGVFLVAHSDVATFHAYLTERIVSLQADGQEVEAQFKVEGQNLIALVLGRK